MRPSCPPPRMPMVASLPSGPRCCDHASSSELSATASVCCLRQASSRSLERCVGQRQHARGEQRRIDGAGLADRERADRHARRHLHDGIERVDARQRLRFDRHAEHRQRGHRRRHAGQVRGAARAGDDDLDAGRLRALGEGVEPVGRAVGRDDALVVADAERVERLGGMPHGRPVRLAPHDDRDRLGHAPLIRQARKEGADVSESAPRRQADTFR